MRKPHAAPAPTKDTPSPPVTTDVVAITKRMLDRTWTHGATTSRGCCARFRQR